MSFHTKIDKADICTADGKFVRPATREEMDAVEESERRRFAEGLKTANLPFILAMKEEIDA